MIDTWVVVADGSHARIFSTDATLGELTAVQEIKNKHHAGEHRHHPDRGPDSGHSAEEMKFAEEIAAEVARAVGAHEVRDVVLVAPAKFLAHLAGALPKSAASHVTAKVGKDLTKVERHALAVRLKETLADSHDAH